MENDDRDITGLLEKWEAGDLSALDELLPLVFDDLHRLARYFFQRESDTHTLQPTALISEIYLRMRGQETVRFESRADFFNMAAEIFRHVLTDYARKRTAEKRGGGQASVSLESGGFADLLSQSPDSARLIDLDVALRELEEVDPRQAQIVTLRFFLGLKNSEIADLLEISESTAKRDWRTAKFFLQRRLKRLPEPSD